MSFESFLLQPTYILQCRPYRESGSLLDVLTVDLGRFTVLAKGVRKSRSKSVGLLQPFMLLTISCFGGKGMPVLTDVEAVHTLPQLIGLANCCGFYLNELLIRFLHPNDPHPELFNSYHQCVADLSSGSELQAALRRFELDLLSQTGYGLDFDYDAVGEPLNDQCCYTLSTDWGFVKDDRGSFPGAVLLAIASRDFADPQVLRICKHLNRYLIDAHLQGRRLKSREVLAQMLGK